MVTLDPGSTTAPAWTGDGAGASRRSVNVWTVVSLASVVGAIAGAIDLRNPTSWAAAGVAIAWAGAAIVTIRHRTDATIGQIALSVPAAVSAVVVCAALDGRSVGGAAIVLGFTIAAVPTVLGVVIALSPDGTAASAGTRRTAWAVGALGAVGAVALGVVAPERPPWLIAAIAVGTVGLAAIDANRRCRTASTVERARLQWIGWGLTVSVAAAAATLGLRAIAGWPDPVAPALVACGAVAAVGLALSSARTALGRIGDVLVHTMVGMGLVAFVAAVYLVVVVGLSGVPDDDEQTVLALSMLAAVIVAVTGLPMQRWLHARAERRVRGDDDVPTNTLETFATRMSRAIPMDELLLQLVESLRATMRLSSAEVWTGSDGRYELAVSVPHRDRERIELGTEPLSVASRAHVQGNAWLGVWVPTLLEGRTDRSVRFVSVAHLGELLGFIVTERPAAEASLDEEDEHRVLIDIARQLGLALHNVRLDNALQQSLDELRTANEELVASRARIVAATDESRRRIERDLHDGAQQHLVALAVKVGLIRQLVDGDSALATTMLEELRGDVQATLTELRELAHGIYPPRLRDRGLADALGAAAERSPLPTVVETSGLDRYGADIETAIYFCCLEAIQNAGKHAGSGASITITVDGHVDSVEFRIVDDGAGFDPAAVDGSHGFVNMRDRIGAFAGTLDVTSSPGHGTTVSGRIPLP